MSYALALQLPSGSSNSATPPNFVHDDDLGQEDVPWSDNEKEAVPFTAGNPRVEHLTGVVHLYREARPASVAQPSTSSISHAQQKVRLEPSNLPSVLSRKISRCEHIQT